MADYIAYYNARQYPAVQTMDEFIANNLVQFNVGADAPSDMYYRGADGWLKRIPIGTDGQVLGVVAGAPGFITVTAGSTFNILNNADNRVLTATGNPDEANAETGMTYNGVILTVNQIIDVGGPTSSTIRFKAGAAYLFGYEYQAGLHAIFSYQADGGVGRYIYSMSDVGVFVINPDTTVAAAAITFDLRKGRARMAGLLIGVTTSTNSSITFINSVDQQCYLIYNYAAFELWTENVQRWNVDGTHTTLYNRLNLQNIDFDNTATNFLVRQAGGEIRYRAGSAMGALFIHNQNAIAQATANFWISGDGHATRFTSNQLFSETGNSLIRLGRNVDTYINFYMGTGARNFNITKVVAPDVIGIQALGESGSYWSRFIINAFNNGGPTNPTLELSIGSTWQTIYFPATGNLVIDDGFAAVDNGVDRLQVGGTIQADALKTGGTAPTMTGATMMAIADTTGRLGFTNIPAEGTTLSGFYRFNTSLTASDPLAGKFRFNTATYSTVTEIYISQTSDNTTDLGNIFGTMKAGDIIYLQDKNDATKWFRGRIIGLPVDHGAWWTVSVAHINSGGVMFVNSEPIGVILNMNAFEADGPISVINVQTTDAANATTVDTDLMGYVVPGNRLLNDLDHLEVTAMFLLAFNSNSKNIKFRFGGATYDIQPFDVTTDNGLFVRVEVIRTSATSQKITLYAHPKSGIMHAVTVNGFETMATAVNMRFVGTGVANGDIIQKSMITKYFPH